MKASEVALAAAKLLDGDREKTHGNKRDCHQNIATLWSGYLSRAFGVQIDLMPSQVAAMMVLLKVARTLAGVHNPDDAVDSVGYSAIMGELADIEASEAKAQAPAKQNPQPAAPTDGTTPKSISDAEPADAAPTFPGRYVLDYCYTGNGTWVWTGDHWLKVAGPGKPGGLTSICLGGNNSPLNRGTLNPSVAPKFT